MTGPKLSRLVDFPRFDRQVFLNQYWDYSPGEHVTFIGPTKSGKTTLKMQLINATPVEQLNCRAIIVDTKPRNAEVDAWAERYRWPITPSVPVPLWTRVRYLGWEWDRFVFRPPHQRGDIDANDARLESAIKNLALRAYFGKGDAILDCDEMLDWVDLKLQRLMRVLWTRGRSMGLGFWAGTQRPFDVPLYAYSQPTHMFFSRDTVKPNLVRLKEIGGIDPDMVEIVVRSLPKFHWLYLRPREGQACILGA